MDNREGKGREGEDTRAVNWGKEEKKAKRKGGGAVELRVRVVVFSQHNSVWRYWIKMFALIDKAWGSELWETKIPRCPKLEVMSPWTMRARRHYRNVCTHACKRQTYSTLHITSSQKSTLANFPKTISTYSPFISQCHSAWSHTRSCGGMLRVKREGINKQANCGMHSVTSRKASFTMDTDGRLAELHDVLMLIMCSSVWYPKRSYTVF